MKATVGRIVHFYSEAIAHKDPSKPGYGLNGQGSGPYVAIVQQTFDGPYVSLKVLGWGVDAWDEGSVSEKPAIGPGVQPGEQHLHGRYWEWPPREFEMAPITGQALDPKTGTALPLSGEAQVSV
jgi:hypothetical protein